MNLIFIVIIVLFVLCFLTLRKKSIQEQNNEPDIQIIDTEPVEKGTGEGITEEKTVAVKNITVIQPHKKLRYCLKCYTPTRPKDLVCRECGEVLQPEALEAYEAQPKKIRYCVNCYQPCRPYDVVCEACGYVIRPKYFKRTRPTGKVIRYCLKCYTPCRPDDLICRECGHELYE